MLLASAGVAAQAADMPKVCQDYVAKIEELQKKMPAMAETYKQGVADLKEGLQKSADAGANTAELEKGCKAGADGIDSMLKQMGG